MPEFMRSLSSGFLRSAEIYPNRPALAMRGRIWSYAELRDRAVAIAATLARSSQVEGPPLTAVFAYRTVTAFEGVLGALLRGHGYVPLNPGFPAARTADMLKRSGCREMIVDAEGSVQVEAVLASVPWSVVVVCPDESEVHRLSVRLPEHRVIGRSDLASPSGWSPAPVAPESPAYLLFTSGSTGVPKSVIVSHKNVLPFLDTMEARYAVGPEDRFSQVFDMTFDLSVFDMFVAWEKGACVCCPVGNDLIHPGRFIVENRLTVWFSVPSTGLFMKRLGALKPGRFPHLRWSLFCGEPLPAQLANQWAAAAPNSIVENLYGPTETTVACLSYRWDPVKSPAQCENGIVPIGDPCPDMSAVIVDEALQTVPEGDAGELLLAGPQVSSGYWNTPKETSRAFVVPPGMDRVHYRTGDRVRRTGGTGPLRFLGRLDDQVKIQGHRVELGEVEAALRDASGVDAILAVAWPRTESGAGGIVAFFGTNELDAKAVLARAAAQLPDYMLPRELRTLASLPLNANGKFDRKALLRMLEDDQ